MKKAWNIFKTVLVWLVVILAACMMVFTIVSLKTADANHRSLFGYKGFIVLSDSMSATDFSAGDVVLIKEVDPAVLQVGDIVSYISRNSHNYGETVTHKIRALTIDENGNPGFITYGTTTDTDDEAVVTYADVLGKYIGRLPGVGRFFAFLKTKQGYMVCILVPFILLILAVGWNIIRLMRQGKQEENAEHDAALTAVQAENERLRLEIAQLKAVLAGNAPLPDPKADTASPVDERTKTENVLTAKAETALASQKKTKADRSTASNVVEKSDPLKKVPAFVDGKDRKSPPKSAGKEKYQPRYLRDK